MQRNDNQVANDSKSVRFPYLKGYILAATTLFSFGLGSCAAQGLQGVIPDAQLTAIRYIFMTPFLLIVAACSKAKFTLDYTHVFWMAISIALSAAWTLTYYAAAVYLPLAELNGIFTICTLATSIVWARLVYHQDITKIQYAALVLCCFGCFCVSQPWHNNTLEGNLQHHVSGNITDSVSVQVINSKLKGYSYIVVSGISLGIQYNVIGTELQKVMPMMITSYFAMFGSIISIILNIYVEPFVLDISLLQLLYVFVHCIGSCLDVITTVFAIQMIGGVSTSIVHSLQILVMLVLQYTLMRSVQPGHRNWEEIVGAILVTIGSCLCPVSDIIMEYKQSATLP